MLTKLLYEALNSLLTEMSLSNTAKKLQTPFQLFHEREAKGGIGEGDSKSCSCFWWTALELNKRRIEKPQVLVELCRLGVGLTQTAKLERHLIIVQLRENGRQNCIYKPCSVRKTAVFEKVLSI